MSSESEAQRVGRRTRRGIAWNLLGSGLTNAVRIAVVAVLGRLLDSGDFGVVTAAMSVMTVLYTIRDIGIGQAVVQRKELTRTHEATAFATTLYLGIAIAIVIVAGAGLIGDLYDIPDSVPLLRVLGVLFAIRGIATLSWVMCQRHMNFRAIAIVDTSGYVAGSAVSITLAALGMGPWSLVFGYVVEAGLGALLYLRLHPPPWTLAIDRQSLRDLLGFGVGSTVMQVVSVVASQGDYFVVGRALGKQQLGLYNRAYELVRFPSTVFTSIVGNVLFPAFARLQDDRDALAQSLRRTLFVNALLLLPAGAALLVVAPEAIRIVLGPGWAEAVLPFRIFALTLLFRTSYKAGAIVARAAGDVYAVAVVLSIYAVCVVGGAAATVRWGIEGVSISTSIAITITYVLLSYLGMRRTSLTWRAFLRAHAMGLVLAGVVGAIGWPLAGWLRGHDAGAVVVALVLAAVSGAVFVVAVAMAPAGADPDLAWFRAEIRHILDRVRRKRPPQA